MHRPLWPLIALSLAACGGGKSSSTLTVTCSNAGGPQLVGATSIDVLGDVVNGRPTINFPDPVRSGKTGSISVQPHGSCTITPRVGG